MTNHAFNLLLLAHPLTGVRDLVESERQVLIDAAKHIEALEERLAQLGN